MRNMSGLFLGGLLLVSNLGGATATALGQRHFLNDLTLSGYIDGSYNFLENKNTFVSGVQDRVFDIAPNGFTLQQFAFTLADQPAQGFGFVINPVLGRDANTLAPYGWDPYFGTQTVGVDPLQVYLQYARNRLTVIGGIFNKLAGAEVVDPTHDAKIGRAHV